jgi:gliding motility-associated-like protein
LLLYFATLKTYLKISALIPILLFSFLEIKAQQCTGALGVAVTGNTFGSGVAQFRGALPWVIDYRYVGKTPEPGEHTITKNNFGMYNGREDPINWFQIIDHTEESADGYFMLVNADERVGTFYEMRYNSFCTNTTYEFAGWFMNLLTAPGAKPNITFSVETPEGVVIKTFSTGNIPESVNPTWIQEGITFNSGNYTDLVLKMINHGEGGYGNDFALDDVTLRACGPTIVSKIDGRQSLIKNVCYGDNPTYVFTAEVSPGYADPEFQWQISTGGVEEQNWASYTGPGANTRSITVSFTNANIGRYIYRLLVADRGKINSPICRVISDQYLVNINKLPEVLSISTAGSTCVGGEITLTAEIGSEVVDAYEWTGPDNFYSTLKSPVIKNITTANSGTYKVSVVNINNCSTTVATVINVSPQIEGAINVTDVTVCPNTPVSLEASGGTIYSWSPEVGLSDPKIANPIATPNLTTVYKVVISNGNCMVEKSVLITVLKDALADAGPDKKVLKGQSVALAGEKAGDNIKKFYWTPEDYLDDPKKLNPLASPPSEMTYTLHVEAECSSSSDEMIVQVFPNIEIPNTFTPNGDGINDTWSISSIAAFPNPRLVVVNRYGIPVFESSKNIPWDGKSKGKDLPMGIYYYTLYINKDYKLYAGWVLISR